MQVTTSEVKSALASASRRAGFSQVESGRLPCHSRVPYLLLGLPKGHEELSRGHCFWFFGTLRSLEGIPVAARDRSNAASDFLICFVR